MRLATASLAALVGLAFCPATPLAQPTPSPSETAPSITVPRIIGLSGEFRPADGRQPFPFEMATFRIYADDKGGVPLWEETQNVAIDSSGRYNVLLGATLKDGIPVDAFMSGQARWLGITWSRIGEVEGTRSPLASVPYALRAVDADTFGGRPPSDYQLAPLADRPSAGARQGTGGSMTGGAEPKAGGAGTTQNTVPLAVLPGTQNFMAKYVSSTDVGNSALYELNGLFGFNTNAPRDIIHSRFTNEDGQLTGIAVQNLGSSATAYSGMVFYDQFGALAQFQGFNNLTHEYRINNIAPSGTINFMTSGNSRFYVTSLGRVGIGTTDPAVAFEHARDAAFADNFFTSYVSSSSSSFVDGRHARGTMAAPLALAANDELASFGGWGYDGAGWARAAFVRLAAAEPFSVAGRGSTMAFFTTAMGTSSPARRMTIDDTGQVGIGVTAPADKLQVVGDIRVGTAGTNGCLKNFAGTGLIGVCSSDARMKTDISPFAPALDRVAALQPVHFNWRAEQYPERHFGHERAYGLVAQEVEKVLPELVVTEKDGLKAVDYTKLPLLTIQAIKELKQRVAELEALVERMRRTTAQQ